MYIGVMFGMAKQEKLFLVTRAPTTYLNVINIIRNKLIFWLYGGVITKILTFFVIWRRHNKKKNDISA